MSQKRVTITTKNAKLGVHKYRLNFLLGFITMAKSIRFDIDQLPLEAQQNINAIQQLLSKAETTINNEISRTEVKGV